MVQSSTEICVTLGLACNGRIHRGIPPPWAFLPIEWKMDTVFLFLKNRLNQPITEGHFVIIDNRCEDLPWLSEEAAGIKFFNDEVRLHFPLSIVVGRIQGQSELMGRTRVEFFLPINEFLPHNYNSRMSINSGPCASLKEIIKTPFVGCIKNADVTDIAFVFMPPFLENGTHAVVFGMVNVFICRYEYKNANEIHGDILCFSPFVVPPNLFDDPFPKRVWDGIIVIQELCRSILSAYSAKQGDYFRATKKVNFPSDVWAYISDFRFEGKARKEKIKRLVSIRQKVDDGIVTKSVRVERQAVQYMFETEQELASFRGVFGKTTTFGKRSRRPIVGESKYLQHLDIINVVVPSTEDDIIQRKRQDIIIRYDGKDIYITIHYNKFIYQNNVTPCPCPVLKAAIAYGSTVAAANHAANTVQIDALFRVNKMILEVVAVHNEYVEAAIISPPLWMGETIRYDKKFVAERVREYIRLL